jgi:hypothetical protein
MEIGMISLLSTKTIFFLPPSIKEFRALADQEQRVVQTQNETLAEVAVQATKRENTCDVSQVIISICDACASCVAFRKH